MLKEVAKTGKSVMIPQKGAFMKEVHSDKYFPYREKSCLSFSREEITGMALSARNISDEEMQKRFFDMAVTRALFIRGSLIWKQIALFFPQGFLVSSVMMKLLLPFLAKKWIVRFIRMI